MSSSWCTFLRLGRWKRFFFEPLGEFLEKFAAKWFAFPYAEHVWPYAGHLSLSRSCFRPQNLHSAISWFLGPFPLSLGTFGFFQSSIWLTAFASSSLVWPGAMSFSFVVVASFARQMSTHFYSVKPDSWSNFLRMPLSRTPQTIWSRRRSSFKVPNSQVLASVLSVVT